MINAVLGLLFIFYAMFSMIFTTIMLGIFLRCEIEKRKLMKASNGVE